MNYTTQWGWQQGVLLLVAIIGLGLIFSFLASLKPKRGTQELRDEYGRTYYRHHHHRHVRWFHGLPGLFLLISGLIMIGVVGAIQEYLGLTGTILVAHIHAVQAQPVNSIPTMSVELVLYDQNKNKSSDTTYIVNGDEVFIQGDVVEYANWMNILGFHSGYKLTKLEGMYSDDNLERNAQHTVIVLNGGDDSLFNTAFHKGWNSFFVTAAYKNGSSVSANGLGYNVCASQDAIVVRRDNESC
jgi:hypothetical protein